MITLQLQLKLEDYLRANSLHRRPPPWLKYMRLGLLSFCLVNLGVLAFKFGVFSEPFLKFISLGFVLLYLILFLDFVIFTWYASRIFSQEKRLHAQYTAVISPTILEMTSEYGNERMPIADFYRYKVGKNLILLYLSEVMFRIFPRRFFTSEEDDLQFLSYLQANLGPPKP